MRLDIYTHLNASQASLAPSSDIPSSSWFLTFIHSFITYSLCVGANGHCVPVSEHRPQPRSVPAYQSEQCEQPPAPRHLWSDASSRRLARMMSRRVERRGTPDGVARHIGSGHLQPLLLLLLLRPL
jgi:hypothetical protein